jgi:hypothetical protein
MSMGIIQKVRYPTRYVLCMFIHPLLDVTRAVETAFKYRDYFRKVKLSCPMSVGAHLTVVLQDIIVDLIVYRRW